MLGFRARPAVVDLGDVPGLFVISPVFMRRREQDHSIIEMPESLHRVAHNFRSLGLGDPDGSRIVTADTGGTSKIWNATPINRVFLTYETASPAGTASNLERFPSIASPVCSSDCESAHSR
jgi:hypothetical protein